MFFSLWRLIKCGGYFFDEVLEFRVWIHPDGNDYFHAFVIYEEAEDFSKRTKGAEEPLALILQKEWVNEPEPGKYIHKKSKRITEWQVQWLNRGKRDKYSIPEMLKKAST
jgi:hypothetical protein